MAVYQRPFMTARSRKHKGQPLTEISVHSYTLSQSFSPSSDEEKDSKPMLGIEPTCMARHFGVFSSE
jgi:hypothetical protein